MFLSGINTIQFQETNNIDRTPAYDLYTPQVVSVQQPVLLLQVHTSPSGPFSFAPAKTKTWLLLGPRANVCSYRGGKDVEHSCSQVMESVDDIIIICMRTF